MSVPLAEGKSGTLDGSGDGTLVIGPVPVGHRWNIERMIVEIDGGVSSNIGAVCRVYRGPALTHNLIDASIRAGLDISELPRPLVLHSGEEVRFVFSGGTAATRFSAAINGFWTKGT